MDLIRELLARLANPSEKSYEELQAARLELAAAFDEWCLTDEALSDPGAELAAEVGAQCEIVDALQGQREATIETRREEMAKLRETVSPKAETGPEDDPENPEVDPDAPPADPDAPPADPEATPDAPEATAPEPELVNAAAGARGRAALATARQHQPPATQAPPAEAQVATIYAAPDLNGFSARQELTMDQAAEAMCERAEAARMADDNAPPTRMRAGRVDWSSQYGDRKLLKANPEVNDKRISLVIGEFPGDTRAVGAQYDSGGALVATGGLCAPVTIRYELETPSSADRPLRSGLTSFNADRGGIQFNGPAVLSSILADQASAALTTTTVAQDAAAGTKTVQEVVCGALTTVQVRAIAERLQFSNFADRYNPERMKQFMQLARAAHSRLAERELFEDMQTASTLVNGGALWVGAIRQWFSNVLVAAAGQRYRHRIDENFPLRLVLPRWFVQLVAIDLGLQSNGERTVLGDWEAEQVINNWLRKGNITPIWQRDDARTNNAQGAGAPAFGAQTGSGATLNDFPGRMVTLLFPEGSFLFLDGGSLDFGIVRDSTLNAANRFQTFYETFEAVAFVGVESLAINTAICASGQGIAGTTTTKCGGVGS